MVFNDFCIRQKWIGALVMMVLLTTFLVPNVVLGQSDVEGELTFYWYEDRFADTMREYIDQFQQEHPGTTINLEIPFSTYFERLPVQISTGDAPDIYFLVSGQVQNYAATGSLMDLRTCVPEAELAQFRPAQIDFSTYDDELIALPFTTTVLTMLVNKDIFESSGIDIPQTFDDAWTWDEFAEVMRTLKANNPSLINVMFAGSAPNLRIPARADRRRSDCSAADCGRIGPGSPAAVRARASGYLQCGPLGYGRTDRSNWR